MRVNSPLWLHPGACSTRSSVYRYDMAKSPLPPEDDTAAAAQRCRQTARNPLIPRDVPQSLLTTLSRLVEVTTPRRGRLVSFTRTPTGTVAARLKRAVEAGLAERDAADRAEPRRLELPERIDAALSAMTECINGMQAFESEHSEIEKVASQQGFTVDEDGSIHIAPEHLGSDDGDNIQARRARLEHRMMSALGDLIALHDRTVATICERLGVDGPEVPWAIIECARGGHDLGPAFHVGAQLPASQLRDLLQRLTSDAARAKATVWPCEPTEID